MGLVGFSAKASTLDDFVANSGNETDFQDTWGQGKMSADIIDGDKTLVCAKEIAWGYRVVNNYMQTLDGATFNADVYIEADATGGYHTIYYSKGVGAGDYFDGGGMNILIEEGSDTSKVNVKVGWWEMNVGMVNDATHHNLWWSKTYDRPENGILNLGSELIANDDESWTLNLAVNGEDNVIAIDKDDWKYAVDNYQGYMGVAGLHENQKTGNKFTKILFNSYSDAKRASYERNEDFEAEFAALQKMKEAYELALTFTSSSSLSDASDVLYAVTVYKDLITSNEDIRRFEKGRANWYYAEAIKILEECFRADKDSYDLIQLGVAVNYFYEKSLTIKTEADAESVEKLRQDVDADTLDDLYTLGLEGVEDIYDKYEEAKSNLNNAKDSFVNKHLTAFETAVADLSTNDKIVAAAALQKNVIIANAKSANRDAYTARYNAACEILKGKIVGYAGDLANNWDIHNVTFVSTNQYNEIKYSASDYYDDDATNDVGITLKGKLKLDGLSFEVTVKSGDYNKDSWFGFFFTKERSIFSVSNHADTGLNESRGIITLVKPYEGDEDNDAYTQVRMGYPNLYGNENDYDLCILPVDLYGNNIKYEFVKEDVDGSEYYVCYITVTDSEEKVLVERYAARKLLASIVDAELDEEGMGYLTFGSCDKTLVGVEAVIHKINGEAAATVTGKAEANPDDGNQGGNTTDPANKKKGCGSAVAGGGALGTIALAVVILSAALFIVCYKKKATDK